jgi:uncharacterized membrane protein
MNLVTTRGDRTASTVSLWRVFGATAAVVGAGALAGYYMRQRSRRLAGDSGEAIANDPYLIESITINQPIERVYEAWGNLQSIGFMRGAELTETREQELCAWRSSTGIGRAQFQRAPGARGTEVRVQIEPAGIMNRGVVRAFGLAPDQQVREDLRRFKQLLETGEVTVSDGPGLWRAAQPPSRPDQLTSWAEV